MSKLSHNKAIARKRRHTHVPAPRFSNEEMKNRFNGGTLINFKRTLVDGMVDKDGNPKTNFSGQAPAGFCMVIKINKNNAIHDVQPRSVGNVNLFDFYHGRPAEYAEELIRDARYLYTKTQEAE